MPLIRTLMALLILALAPVLAVAEPGANRANLAVTTWLSGKDIQDALAGKTIDGRYADGSAFTESYGDDGRLWYLDQRLGNYLTGHWSVTAGTLCTIYDTDPAGGCFRVVQVGKNCFEFYFVARTEAAAPQTDEKDTRWTARGAVSGKSDACPDEASV